MTPLDVAGILERAGADENAPEGSQAWALAQVGVAVAELIEAAKEASGTLGHAYHTTLTGQLAEYAHTDYQRLDAALARVQGGAE